MYKYLKLFNTKKKRLIVTIIVFLGILCFSFLYYKLNSLYHIGVPCVFYEITGLYCPGCGITRTVFAIIRLDFVSAIHNNFLIITVIPFVLYYLFIKLKNWILFKDNDSEIYPMWFWYTLAIFTFLFGILRNFEFFSILAPID